MSPLLLALLAAPAHATVCDDALFAVIPPPAPTDGGQGVATGTSTLDGKEVVGGRFSIDSAHPVDAWRKVLLEVESQDEWVPERFGYEIAEWIDAEYMYMRFDIGFLANSIHVRRQLVVRVTSGEVGGRFRTCWRMVDPAPHLPKIQGRVAADVDWERASTGWWEVTPEPDGTAVVHYQWWAESGKIPTSIQRFGLTRTIPDLMRAFEARVAQIAGR